MADPMSVKAAEDAVYRRVAWRLIPFLMLCYTTAYLDRVNVGFAKLGMMSELGLNEAVYGLGAGIFFIGYFIFEVPSNLMLHRMGARRWIARIMISWAVASAACAWIEGAASFYILRFLLGVAEAGFFPGIILYLTYWFPAARRGQIISLFMVAIPLAGLIGGPVSGFIMNQFDGVGGWSGWRWMVLLEAAPALVLGLMVPFVLSSRVEEARWLSPGEREIIVRDLARDQDGGGMDHARLRDLFLDRRLLKFAFIYFCCIMGQYGITFWLPSLIAQIGRISPLMIGLYSALPYGCAVVAMVALGRLSDRTGERRWFVIGPLLAGAASIALIPQLSGQLGLSLALLCVAAAVTLSATPLFWNLPTAMLQGTAAAAGIAAINSIGNLAGFASPLLVGWINDRTGSGSAGMTALALALLAGAIATWWSTSARNAAPVSHSPV